MSVNGKPKRANRLSYEIHKGEIPKGMEVCHSCDNPSCVNPDHLWLGTHKDNIRDCHKKGRANICKGSKKPQSKLTEKDVLEIREKYNNPYTSSELSKIYGVCKKNILTILHGNAWKHVFFKKLKIERKSTKGENNKLAKLNEKQIVQIREQYPTKSVNQLSIEFKISKTQISMILRGKSWKHIEGECHKLPIVKAKGEKSGQHKLTESQVLEIRSIYPSKSLSQLSREYDVTKTNISRIINRKIWKHI